ncbi:iron-regulated protein a [Leptolyngbya sp. Heron Island J]|nr:iron-regulated protein a [Leptolyngbya sp. Heron Island J]
MLGAGAGYALEPDLEVAMKQLNEQFSTSVIIPGYEALGGQMERLVLATQSFEAEPTEANLAAVRTAWLAAVSSWTSTNTVAFGPVHSLGYSTALEFPADEAGIDTLLATTAETEAFDVESLLPSLQGFEAMAYLLGTANNKTAADFSNQERRYLSALVVRADGVTTDLLTVWQTGWNSNPAYGTLLSTAGSPGNHLYLSVESGSEEIIRSIVNSLEVISAEELPDILEASELLAESPDTTTLQLLSSGIQGIQSAYVGTTAELGMGVSGLVAIANPTIDQQIQSSLVTALNSIDQAISDPTNTVPLFQAQRSVDIAFELLQTEILPLVQN